ncbi:MAG: PP2C family protein-serine/threonine phosphatase [Acidobacteriota bacterium]
MNDAALRVLENAERQSREGGAGVPEVVLDAIGQATGTRHAVLGRGGEIIARWGGGGEGAVSRIELTAGRDAFWLELTGGNEPDRALSVAARTALASWSMREELKKARFAERRRLWEVESLRAIAEVLGGTLEPAQIAESLVLHATALLDARRGEVWLPEGSAWRYSAQVEGPGVTGLCADGSCVVAARVGGPVLGAAEAAGLADAGLLEDGRLAVAIVGRRGRLGVVALAEREVRGGLAAFACTDAETLQLFASQAAVALENAVLHKEDMDRRLLEREIEVAAAVQRELLPRGFTAPPGFEIAARTEPCRHVGGDVYDLVETPGGLVILAGDVTGKGVPAALMASSLQAAVRLLARSCSDVHSLASQLHLHLLATTPENKFATLFVGVLGSGGRLSYVSAGHNPSIVVKGDGTSELLHSSGPPLGLLPGVAYDTATTELNEGSLLVLYTDGFSEAPSATTGEDYGVERLVSLAVENRTAPLDSLVDRVFQDVASFTAGQPAHDDRTLVVVRRVAAS